MSVFKMFVWRDPFPDANYSGGAVVAVAKTLDEAKELALAEYPGYHRPLKTLGDPDQILKLPAAVIYDWTE